VIYRGGLKYRGWVDPGDATGAKFLHPAQILGQAYSVSYLNILAHLVCEVTTVLVPALCSSLVLPPGEHKCINTCHPRHPHICHGSSKMGKGDWHIFTKMEGNCPSFERIFSRVCVLSPSVMTACQLKAPSNFLAQFGAISLSVEEIGGRGEISNHGILKLHHTPNYL